MIATSKDEFIKHLGKLKNTNKNIVVVFHILPGTKDQALVCDIDALPPRLADNVTEILYSGEAQQSPVQDLYYLFSRRLSSEGGKPIINELHERGYLMAVPQNLVLMTPRPNIVIPLDQLVRELLSNNGMKIDKSLYKELFQDEQKERQIKVTTENLEEFSTNNNLSGDLPEDVVNALNQAKREIENVQNKAKTSLDVPDELKPTHEVALDIIKEDIKQPENKNNVFEINKYQEELAKRNELSYAYLRNANNALSELEKNLQKAYAANPGLYDFIIQNYDNIGSRSINLVKKMKEDNQYLAKNAKVIDSSAFSAPKVRRGRPRKNG